MEMNNGTKFSCSHGEEMLAYLYDELSPEGRERFEAHMQGCFECIDEFAELAVSRYSVFEWRSVEFAPMATPKFVIPTEREPARASWLDGIRAAFAWNGWAVVGGAAVILLLAVIGISLWNVPPDSTIAGNDPGQVKETTPAIRPNVTSTVSTDAKGRPETASSVPAYEPQLERTPTRRITPQRNQTTVTKAVTARKEPAPAIQTRRVTASQKLHNSPTLGQYVEDQDDSLRLSDIFDDLDTKDME